MMGRTLAGIAAVLAAGLLALPHTATAQGKDLYSSKGCVACHGPDGKQPIQSTYARLAGQQADYLVAQLQAFKAKERTNGQAALMWPMAALLSDAEMTAIAQYLESVK